MLANRKTIAETGYAQMRWVVLLLAAAVVLPTVCLLWFMNRTVQNERLAIRQRLLDSYRNSLTILKEYNEDIWLKLTEIPAQQSLQYSPEAFLKALVRTKNYGKGDYDHGDAILVYDANGMLAYPLMEETAGEVAEFDRNLSSLEFTQKDYAAAAGQYRAAADKTGDETARLRLLAAVVRNLAKAGSAAEALEQCAQILRTAKPRNAVQRNMVMQLRLLQLTICKNAGCDDYPQLLDRFLEDLTDWDAGPDYSSSPLADSVAPTASTVFLLKKAVALADESNIRIEPAKIRFARKLIAAHTIAMDLASKYPNASAIEDWPEKTAHTLTPKNDLFGYVINSANAKILIVFNADNLRIFFEIYSTRSMPKDLDYSLTNETGFQVVGSDPAGRRPLLESPVNKYFPRWDIAVFLKDNNLFKSAARRKTAVYIWAGTLTIVLILGVGGLAGRVLGRQMKLNRLKNDFIATVTHELKTPLASMRVLADTLLEGNYKDPGQAREYLELICKENKRLTSLIDNFLTFSRMERNKHAFDIVPTDPAEIARTAADAVRTKLEKGRCELTIDIEPSLPRITADADAIVTAIINLLDNACKYSRDDRTISLKVFAVNGSVAFSVSDNGIGIPKREVNKIFRRFYQVDRTLSRRVEGAGLGLAIVKFIIDAHDGSICVGSIPGRGSTFTVRLPAVT
ncbi:MAG: hypothetical protein JW720_12250 [Sedimentisphaerales bacterium]|nr:hypothetical protein [Sedimentisphaerales bacterium]